MKLSKEQFLPAITTIGDNPGSLWKDKIKEATELGLKKTAVFLTCLSECQRRDFYCLLEKSSIKEVPFVHIRSDMSPSELGYFEKKFKTKVFNTHSSKQYPLKHDLKEYRKKLFIENTFPWDEKEIKEFAGVCLDFSHLKDAELLRPNDYENNLKVLRKYSIGCNHISALNEKVVYFESEEGKTPFYSSHIFTNLSQFDYLKQYPKEFFSRYCAIELENSLKEQIKAIDYIYEICR